MRLLALDTAAELCAACVWDAAGGVELGRSVEKMRTGHAERLMAVISRALETSGGGFADLRRIAVSVGPGSFTGIRVGVATARGLSLALKIPAVGVSTLDAVAAQASAAEPGRPVLALLGAGTGPIAAAAYDREGKLLYAPAMLDLSATEVLARGLSAPVLAGSAAQHLASLLPAESFTLGPVDATADVATFAKLAAAREPGDKPVPLYLRAPDAKPQNTAGVARLPG